MKLALGSVQFGMNYGISNTQGQTSFNEVEQILRYAHSQGIDCIDTAYDYGESEKVIGTILNKSENSDLQNSFNIVSKIPFRTDRELIEVANYTEISLERLQRKQIYGMLMHNAIHLVESPARAAIYEALLSIKEAGLVKKIGASAASREQLEYILQNVAIDLVQIPINILDRRLMDDNLLDRLKERGVEIHARSLFVQGLLFMDVTALPAYFTPYKPFLMAFHQRLKEMQVTPLQAGLAFVKNLPQVDRMVVGVNNAHHLREIVSAYQADIENNFADMGLKDEALLNPRLWCLD